MKIPFFSLISNFRLMRFSLCDFDKQHIGSTISMFKACTYLDCLLSKRLQAAPPSLQDNSVRERAYNWRVRRESLGVVQTFLSWQGETYQQII